MYRVAVTISSCVLLFALACDKGGGADKSAEAKPEDQKQPTAKQDEPAAKPEDSAAKPEPVAPDPAHGIGGVIHEQAPEAAPAPVADPAPAADPRLTSWPRTSTRAKIAAASSPTSRAASFTTTISRPPIRP
jgi:hypothetical protein